MIVETENETVEIVEEVVETDDFEIIDLDKEGDE